MASSPRGDITGSTYTDLGATTPEALAISTRSREFARQEIGNETLEDRVRQRCAIAVGDLAMAGLLRFRLDPVEAGLAALEAGAPIVADIRMVEVGLQKRGHASPVLCMLDYGADRRSHRRDHPDLGRPPRPRRQA